MSTNLKGDTAAEVVATVLFDNITKFAFESCDCIVVETNDSALKVQQ